MSKTKRKKYVAIIADIIGSKVLEDRNASQSHLKLVLDEVNSKYKNALAAKFAITLGDEFQGLLVDRSLIFKIVHEIELAMSPIPIRFGIGIGEVTTHINFDYSAEVDGSAFHRARKMIVKIKESENQYAVSYSNILIQSAEDISEQDQLMNILLSTISSMKSRWTTRQKEVIVQFWQNGKNQYKTADAMGIGQSSVSRALKHTDYYTFEAALEFLSDFISRNGDNEA